jgi:uncharacterized protein YbjT (DUF2867 family)
MARVLVTGGRGVLGSAVIPKLLAAGYTVRSASRSLPGADGDSRVEWMRADLVAGEGWADAVKDVDIIIHTASAGLGDSYQADVVGTKHLLDAAKSVSVKHFIYVSIVGIDKIDYKYYHHKLAVEKSVEASGVPYTIARISQFHDLIDKILTMLVRFPIAFVDTGWKLQLIDESDAAQRLVEAVAAGPSGRVPDTAGPEIRRMSDLTRSWLAARGKKPLIIPVPFPGGLWAGFRKGLTTTPGRSYGSITWEQWLAKKYGTAEDAQPSAQRAEKGQSA